MLWRSFHRKPQNSGLSTVRANPSIERPRRNARLSVTFADSPLALVPGHEDSLARRPLAGTANCHFCCTRRRHDVYRRSRGSNSLSRARFHLPEGSIRGRHLFDAGRRDRNGSIRQSCLRPWLLHEGSQGRCVLLECTSRGVVDRQGRQRRLCRPVRPRQASGLHQASTRQVSCVATSGAQPFAGADSRHAGASRLSSNVEAVHLHVLTDADLVRRAGVSSATVVYGCTGRDCGAAVALLSQAIGELFFDVAAFKKHMGVYPPVTMVRR